MVNLTLLPVTPEDIAYLDHQLGTGRVLLLTRGYGNCPITNTRHPHCWRVVYYNSMDAVILNTVEVVDMPEVAMAAPEDLRDSHTRLADVLATPVEIRRGAKGAGRLVIHFNDAASFGALLERLNLSGAVQEQ